MTSTTPHRGISVIVPAFNEAEAIASTLVSLQTVLKSLDRPSEILVIDDGSSDGTGGRAQIDGVQVIQHPINSGYGRAILTGIDASRYSSILIVDADGTYEPECIAELLTLYDKGFDMAVGARQGQYYYSSLGKRVMRGIFRFLAEFTTGRSIPDVNSGLRIFRKDPVLSLRESISTGFSFTTTITLLFLLNGLFVGYTAIPYHKRIGRSKVRVGRDALRSLQIIVTAIARFNPLKLYVLLLGADALCSGILMLAAHAGYVGPLIWFIFITWQVACIIIAAAILSVSAKRPSSAPCSSPS